MTARGDVLALQLSRRGVPVSDHVRDVCGLLARTAVTIQRLTEEECNGPTWVDRPYATSERLEKWGEDLQRRMDRAEVRFGKQVATLREAVAFADPDGVNKFIGGWRVFGDPRGSTADIMVTRGDRDEWVAVIE
jgi:hypothetical protein